MKSTFTEYQRKQVTKGSVADKKITSTPSQPSSNFKHPLNDLISPLKWCKRWRQHQQQLRCNTVHYTSIAVTLPTQNKL